MSLSIAVIGLNGALGTSTLEAIQSEPFNKSFSLPILAVTRDSGSKNSTDVVKYVQGDISEDWKPVAESLKGVDVVIALTNPNSKTFTGLEGLVAHIKPKLYIPSQFGVDIAAADKVLPGFLEFKNDHSQKVREQGVKTVDIVTSLFAGGPWLYERIGHFGGDLENKTVTYLGSPDESVSFTNIKDIGRVVAAIASKATEELPQIVRVQSEVVTPKQVIEKYENSHGVKLEVKETVPKEKVLEQARAIWDQKDYSKFTYLLNVLISQGGDQGVYFEKNDDELVNPGESVWKWEKF